MSKSFALIAVVTIAATGLGVVAASAPPPAAAATPMVVYKSPT
jgi:hypothetical protein